MAKKLSSSELAEKLWPRLGPLLKAKLNEISTRLIEDGYVEGGRAAEPFDLSDEEYEVRLSLSPAAGNGDDEEIIDIAATLAEEGARSGEGDDHGLAILVDFSWYSGSIIGEYAPHNYSEEVWTEDERELVHRIAGFSVDAAVRTVEEAWDRRGLGP